MTGTYQKDMFNMLLTQCYTDLILIVGSAKFAVHKFMLAAGSNPFYRLLTTELSDMGGRSSSESSMVCRTFIFVFRERYLIPAIDSL